jgi:hypothetical protein
LWWSFRRTFLLLVEKCEEEFFTIQQCRVGVVLWLVVAVEEEKEEKEDSGQF